MLKVVEAINYHPSVNLEVVFEWRIVGWKERGELINGYLYSFSDFFRIFDRLIIRLDIEGRTSIESKVRYFDLKCKILRVGVGFDIIDQSNDQLKIVLQQKHAFIKTSSVLDSYF